MKRILLFFLTISCGQLVLGQVETKFFPEGNSLEHIEFASKNQLPVKKNIMPSFDVSKMLEEDMEAKDMAVPFRFGKAFDTNINLSNGVWTNVDNGRMWSMGFQSKDAYSINFVFNDFYLPDGAQLFISNENGTMLYGPVTSIHNTGNGYFLTDLVESDDVIIYLFEPLQQHGKTQLTIKSVVHAYKNVLPTLNSGLNSSLGCHNDIECFPAWDLESDAVGLVLLSSGDALCSGALLMNTDQNFKPYFLSAFHCIDSDNSGSLSTVEKNNAQNWMFKFQYKKTSCNGSSANLGTTYNGASFKAAYFNTDFALMEMINTPAGNNQISWLGWDRTANIPTSGTSIHHPTGDVMKISFDNVNTPPIASNSTTLNWANGTSPLNTHWNSRLDDGTTEPGSSGSPFFNQNRRVVGQLHGGFGLCAPATKHFGRFNLSWTGGGSTSTQLSYWLDSCGSGATTTNTTRSPALLGNNTVCPSGASYSIPNLPAGSTISWSSSGNLMRTSAPGANPCTFSANSYGNAWIQAVITRPGVCGTMTLKRNVVAGSILVEVFTTNNPAPPSGMANIVVNVVNGTSPFKYKVNSGPLLTSYDSNWIVTVPCNTSANIRVDSQNS